VLDRTWCLRTAFENRLDYRAAVASAEEQEIRLKFAKNQLLPQLDLVGTFGYNGLADSYDSARDRITHQQAQAWSVGIQLSIPLGNVQARAQYRAIQGFKEQAILNIKQNELQVSIDVDTVISRIETARQSVETARQTRQLNDEAVRIANRRLEEGPITQFWFATGTVLERTGIVFSK
jgi:outer membrane protein